MKQELIYTGTLWQDEQTGDGLFGIVTRSDGVEHKLYGRLPVKKLERQTELLGEIRQDKVFNLELNPCELEMISGRTKKEKAKRKQQKEDLNALLQAINEYPELPASITEKLVKSGKLENIKTAVYSYDEVPFRIADVIGRRTGCPLWQKERIDAAFRAAVKITEGNGNTWENLVVLLKLTQKLLGKPETSLSFLYMNRPRWLITDYKENTAKRADLDRNEKAIGNGLAKLGLAEIGDINEEMIEQAEQTTGFILGEEQREAVLGILKSPVAILTGDPGTGKTTTINVLVTAYEMLNPEKTITLCAPTGRASQRMAETTGRNAQTIHRVLNYHTLGDHTVYKNELDPIETDLLIVDEFSMVDTELMAILLKAMKPQTQLVIIGDNHQLESVGPGSVLFDLIQSGKLPHFHLSKIYRQAEGSGIVENARKVKDGEKGIKSTPDCRFAVAKSEQQLLAGALKFIREAKAKNEPLQILLPNRTGDVGTFKLNQTLQNIFNPKGKAKKEIRYKGRIFREGDKVIFTRNEPDAGYMNGDIGLIAEITDAGLTINQDGYQLPISRDALEDLDLAYAITIHKSQGSEFPHGLILLPYNQKSKMLLRRNLLYTAITRCKETCTVVGMVTEDGDSIRYAISNQGDKRQTDLQKYL